jgi:hypothetical protein
MSGNVDDVKVLPVTLLPAQAGDRVYVMYVEFAC